MTVSNRLLKLLIESGVPHELMHHHRAATAQQTALAECVPAHSHAKVVVAHMSGRNVMAVVPADRRVNMAKLGDLARGPARLEFEDEFDDVFADCERGAMPPFGVLYSMPTYVDASLSDNEYLCFNAGSHRDSIRMRWDDYVHLARPIIGDFSEIRF